MFFETKTNLVSPSTLPQCFEIIGLITYPIREVKENRVVTGTEKCEHEKASGFAAFAILDGGSHEWLGDFKTQESAKQFTDLIQCIYYAGKNSKITAIEPLNITKVPTMEDFKNLSEKYIDDIIKPEIIVRTGTIKDDGKTDFSGFM